MNTMDPHFFLDKGDEDLKSQKIYGFFWENMMDVLIDTLLLKEKLKNGKLS